MKDFFYNLLPAIYRELDHEQGSPLRSLLHVLDEEHSRLIQDTEQMYEDWFVETCSEDKLSAIASLLSTSSLPVRRAFVANMIAARRRKGTFAALERSIADACGWPALAILRPDNNGASHALEVYVWRQTAYSLRHGTPHHLGDNRYLFHPLGVDTPLFHVPRPQYDIERRMTLDNMPLRLYRNAPRELRAPLTVEIPSQSPEPLPIEFHDLSHWEVPHSIHQSHERAGHQLYAVVDPVLGRLVIAKQGHSHQGQEGSHLVYPDLRVNFAYGFTTDIGGGNYPRSTPLPPADSWVAYVQPDAPPHLAANNVFPTLMDALHAFQASPCCGTIFFTGRATHSLPTEIIDTTSWVCPQAMNGQRSLELRSLDDEVACLRGHLRIHAGGLGLRLKLNGLWMDGVVEVGGALSLDLVHSTIRPANGHCHTPRGIRPLPGYQPGLRVRLESSICGPILLPSDSKGLTASGSIIESIGAGHHPDHRQSEHEEHLNQLETSTRRHAGLLSVNLQHSTVLHDVASAHVENHESILGSDHSSGKLFVSTRYGDPSYACLRDNAPSQLLTGATDGSQLGAFHSMDEALRREQAKEALAEFTPANLPAKLIFIPQNAPENPIATARPGSAQTSPE